MNAPFVFRPEILSILAGEDDAIDESSGARAARGFQIMLEVDRVLDVPVMGRPLLIHDAAQRTLVQCGIEIEPHSLIQQCTRKGDEVSDLCS